MSYRTINHLRSIRIVEILDIPHQVLHATPSLAILPLAAVTNAANFVVESDCAACCDVRCIASLEAVLEQVKGEGTLIISSALIDFGNVNAVF